MPKTFLVLASAGLLLAGCAVSKEIYFPNGRMGYSISCDGPNVGMNVCIAKAQDLCSGRGFNVVTPRGRVYPMGNAMADVADAFPGYLAMSRKTILIACK